MVAEFVQNKETNPIIQPPSINSTARGSENLAKVFGQIAERAGTKATEYASEASKANLLQTHSLLQDVEAQSKIDIFKSPGQATTIAKNAEQTIAKIKNSAKLNRSDKLSLESMANSTTRGLNLTAAEKEISLSRERAKYATLSAFGDTLQSIRRDIHIDPDKADALIAAQYESLKGQVSSGIITAVEAANIHKQLTAELEMAHELVQGIKSGALSASDINAYHATEPGQIPMSNAHLPIATDTAMNSNHYFGQLTLHDIQAKMANGERVSPRDLVSIKSITDLDKVLNYGSGAARATGDINSGASWLELNKKLETLKKKDKLSAREEGYKNRLNNFIVAAKEPGHYQNFIAGMPEGARAYQDYAQNQTAIDSDVMFGSDEQVALQKHIRSVDNLNELISKSASIGIGMHYPDSLRQPIPQQYLNPIVNSFNKDGDIVGAINNIQMLNPKNRVYAMNAFPGNYRKQLTVLEIGTLSGKADAGFLTNLLESQQVDALGEKPGKKDAQEKFLQLAKDKGFSDNKLIARIMPKLTAINGYLSKQPNGGNVVSAKADQALRYVKTIAEKHNDFSFEHLDDYIDEFAGNMEKAYGVSSGFNFSVSKNDIPLEENQIQVLASHAINNEVRQKLLEYRTPAQVDALFSTAPPIMVSSPGGRITVISPNGRFIPDKDGHPAFSELYSESVWRKAEHDLNAQTNHNYTVNPLFGKPYQVPVKNNSVLSYIRGRNEIIRPVAEGNIDLENRPKIWNEKGEYQTVKTITREFDGKTVLLPTIINGKEVTVKQATDHYIKTGEHLGIFKTKEEANKYDKQLHERMGWLGKANKWEEK